MTSPGSNSHDLDSIHLTNIYDLAAWAAGPQQSRSEQAVCMVLECSEPGEMLVAGKPLH